MHVGLQLKRAREAAGLSAEDVAQRTRIQRAKIDALEQDAFELLPEGIYLDGLIRAYAREVELDGDTLVAQVHSERAAASADRTPAVGPSMAEQRPGIDELARFDPLDEAILSAPPLTVPAKPTTNRQARWALATGVLLAAFAVGWFAGTRLQPPDREPVVLDRPANTDAIPGALVAENAPSSSAHHAEPTLAPDGASVGRPSAPAVPPGDALPGKPGLGASGAATDDVSGVWTVVTQVERTSYRGFEGLHLGYRLQLEQVGNRVIGTGQKISENGRPLRGRARTPIRVQGTIDGERVELTFTERGAQRTSRGKFVLLVEADGQLRGRFSSTAANSSGIVQARRAGASPDAVR